MLGANIVATMLNYFGVSVACGLGGLCIIATLVRLYGRLREMRRTVYYG